MGFVPSETGLGHYDTRPDFRVLLADDAEDNRLVIQAFLKGTPYRIEEAQNGAEAFDRFQESGYDAVLMDLNMPIMDGYTATRKIREWEAAVGADRTPVIALTARAMLEDSQQSLAAGCDLHLSKPIRKARLIEALDRFLAEKPS